MKRNALIQLLEAYCPTPEESACKYDMIQFAKKHPDCFERSLAIGHFTASAWLLSNDWTSVLLMHHAKLNRWLQLGGHSDGNPDLLSVAIQEAKEESGIQSIIPVYEGIFDIDIHLIPENTTNGSHLHYDVRFLLQVTGDEIFVANSESLELRWISQNRQELPTEEPSVLRMFNKWVTVFPSS